MADPKAGRSGKDGHRARIIKRKFAKLKAAMYATEITQADIAREVGRSVNYISLRMTGREPFNVEEVKKIGTMLHLDRAQWLDYFLEGA